MDDIYAMTNEHELGVQTTASCRRGRAGRGGSRGRSSDSGGCAPPSSGQACLHRRRRGHQNEEEEEAAAACPWPAADNGDRSACRLLDVRVVYGEVWTTRSCLLCSSCALWLYIWLASGSGFLTVAVVDQLQWSILFHENLALFLAFL